MVACGISSRRSWQSRWLDGAQGRRVKKLVYDEQQALTAANLDDECKLMFADMRDGLHGGSEKTVAALWRDENYVWEGDVVRFLPQVVGHSSSSDLGNEGL